MKTMMNSKEEAMKSLLEKNTTSENELHELNQLLNQVQSQLAERESKFAFSKGKSNFFHARPFPGEIIL